MTTVKSTSAHLTVAVPQRREKLNELVKKLEKLSQTRGNIRRIEKCRYLITLGSKSLYYYLSVSNKVPPRELCFTVELRKTTANDLRKIHNSLYALLEEKIANQLIRDSITKQLSIGFNISTDTKYYRPFFENGNMIYGKYTNNLISSTKQNSILILSMKQNIEKSEESTRQWKITLSLNPKMTELQHHQEIRKTVTEKVVIICLSTVQSKTRTTKNNEYAININNKTELEKMGISINKGTRINIKIPIPTSWKAFINSMPLYGKIQSIFSIHQL